MKASGWYPIFLRETLLFRRKLLKLGYLFSAMVSPLIYLVAFGLGLGRSVQIQGSDYLSFLIPGLIAMSSMNNSYTWVASSLNLNRLYFKTFQIFVQAPVSSSAIMIGEAASGMVKGLFASALIILTAFFTPSSFSVSAVFIAALLLNCFMFASLGVVTGMLAKSHEDTSTYNNFFIMPMAFFTGAFFPIDSMPTVLKWIVYIFPLTHTNILMRKEFLDQEGLISLAVLIFYAAIFFIYGSRLIRNYSE